ncbi:hypothetical protein BCR37DRAFT_318686 [Protomyces lactucae-debilis]|uniref:Uncharacterized protein n=1 Tax=Protomyces lactucae-debilis TaxID=2754530 RepID=A0A1Y2FIL6_PROLT|nr:uncharacterized protein BCR37DRAFT_318686 [Protomyces lactucae-debilis]ORY82655.1 hypothetical protein BCR37DRAFT_318686 [Protomyces lactucae-debilis]
MSNYKENLKKEARDQTSRAFAVGKDAVASTAWIYPLKGILYCLGQKKLLQEIQKQLMPKLVMAIAVTIVLFATVYVPQALAMALFSGPLAFISAVPLVLSEANLLINILSTFFLNTDLDLIFDKVLLEKGHETLVGKGRVVGATGSGKQGHMKAKLTSGLQKFSPQAVIRYLLTLPLNFIPAIGTILFLVLNGRKAGPRYMSRYWQLKGENSASVEREKTGSLTAFGTATVLLGMVPVANQFFEYTNTVGAALFASDLEKGAQAGGM